MDRDASLTFRLPRKLREALQVAADAERRSLSAMAVVILEDALVDRGFLKRPTTTDKRRRD
jgi:predicted transcriptional regulator